MEFFGLNDLIVPYFQINSIITKINSLRACVSLNEVTVAKITVQPVVYKLNKSTDMGHR